MKNHRKTHENKGRSLHICREIGENTEKNAISPICRPYFGEIEKKICLSSICPKSPPPAGAHQARRRPTMQPKICSLPGAIKPAGGRQCSRKSAACRGSSSPPGADNATENPPSAGAHQARRKPTMQPKIRRLLRLIKPAGGRQCSRKSAARWGSSNPPEIRRLPDQYAFRKPTARRGPAVDPAAKRRRSFFTEMSMLKWS